MKNPLQGQVGRGGYATPHTEVVFCTLAWNAESCSIILCRLIFYSISVEKDNIAHGTCSSPVRQMILRNSRPAQTGKV